MAVEIFNRFENKYVLTEENFSHIRNFLCEHMTLDDYNKNGDFYTVANIYYDTNDDYLIRTSLSKPKYKEKLRLRSYGIPNSDTYVFAEIKKKFNGIVGKRRSALMKDEAYDFLETGILPDIKSYMNKQVLFEIWYILQMRKLLPKVYIAYDRIAYFGIDNRDLRVSFDFNIRTRRDNLKLESDCLNEYLLNTGSCIMEIKAIERMPVWLINYLSHNKIYPVSFSKYGEEYRRHYGGIPIKGAI